MTPEKFRLSWNEHESNFGVAFRDLREEKEFFDVTLACEDEQIEAHKAIVSSCSLALGNILKKNKHPHPFVYLKDVKVKQLSSILDFMYNGRVHIEIDLAESFLATAQELWVKGLAHEDNLALNCKTPSSKKIAAGRNLDLELSLRRHDGDTAAEIQSHTPSRVKLKPGHPKRCKPEILEG